MAERHRQPPLLVGDPKLTFLWDEPSIYYPRDHCRNYSKWVSISDFLASLAAA
ncbi:hypothetical protein [Roseiconus lacunae]|uniref:hypothetical protein n=1 Tax=Roseiconus lacunae TaxID=2605694 RepID=UPI001E5AA917|nr:hypothetical protein [Roseiconus lacunae]MCD0458641.1 hypothetical protein [Roseiconus lacunae]